MNPLMQPSSLDFGAPDFSRLGDEHFAPAFEQGMAEQRDEVRRIGGNPEPPTFANTIEALERSGRLLMRTRRAFGLLIGADSNAARQALYRDMAPKLAAHADALALDQALFARVRELFERRDSLALSEEQDRLLDRWHTHMVRKGAALDEAGRGRLQAINQRLAELDSRFQDNLLAETAAFVHHVTDESHLAGLSAGLREEARAEAGRRGLEGGWAFTLQEPVVFALLADADHRPLREAVYTAFKGRGNNGNEHDNNAIVIEMAGLRAEAAALLGYPTHAHYVLDDNMAKTPEAATAILTRLWRPALTNAAREAERLQAQVDAEGGGFELAPWDWWYYAERVRRAEYDFDGAALKPYLALDKVRDGAFMLAERLWGLRFEPRDDIPAHVSEAEVFEVRESDGRALGLLYLDYLTRASKRSGAWMNELQPQSRLLEQVPLVSNTANFGPAAADGTVLLSFDEANTVFHEFGHALHGLMSAVTYPSLSGTSVARDFVELPSQLMENWLREPVLLREFARHHETGEPIPEEMIERLLAAQRFNEGFSAVEYLASALVDMAWHSRAADAAPIVNAIEFENAVMAEHGLIPQILPRHRSTHFRHIFAGGYAAGYYSYVWAQVLDADAFNAFEQQGLFDRALAARLRDAVLSRGGGVEPMQAYVRFRGAEPSTQPLLRRLGLEAAADAGA